jgi:hypothetical protein
MLDGHSFHQIEEAQGRLGAFPVRDDMGDHGKARVGQRLRHVTGVELGYGIVGEEQNAAGCMDGRNELPRAVAQASAYVDVIARSGTGGDGNGDGGRGGCMCHDGISFCKITDASNL